MVGRCSARAAWLFRQISVVVALADAGALSEAHAAEIPGPERERNSHRVFFGMGGYGFSNEALTVPREGGSAPFSGMTFALEQGVAWGGIRWARFPRWRLGLVAAVRESRTIGDSRGYLGMANSRVESAIGPELGFMLSHRRRARLDVFANVSGATGWQWTTPVEYHSVEVEAQTRWSLGTVVNVGLLVLPGRSWPQHHHALTITSSWAWYATEYRRVARSPAWSGPHETTVTSRTLVLWPVPLVGYAYGF